MAPKVPAPHMEERKRDEDTDRFIRDLLKEQDQMDAAAKRAKREGGGPSDAKTLDEIEREEGGPVKESLVGMAQTKRALGRKKGKKDVDLEDEEDLEILEDREIARFEEDLEGEAAAEKNEVPLEPFNMKRENKEGYFNEDGVWVERPDPDAVKDAWLDSEEAKVVSDEVRRKAEAAAAAAAAADAAPALPESQIALLKRDMALNMLEGETVIRALKRLGGDAAGGRAMGKRERQRLAAAAAAAGGGAAAAGAGADPKAFAVVTDAANTLLNAGELDIYEATKRELEVEAAMFLPKEQPKQAGGDDDDDDMFASDDEKPAKRPAAAAADDERPAKRPAPAAPASGASAAAGDAPAAAAPARAPVDYASWPVKELRRFLTERGQDSSSMVEKSELVAAVKAAAAKGPQGAAAAGQGTAAAPPGYSYDPASGYHYSTDSGMYWDPASGCYYDGSSNKWYTFDGAAGQFVECGAAGAGST